MENTYFMATIYSQRHDKHMVIFIKGSLFDYTMKYGELEPIVFATPISEYHYKQGSDEF